MPVVRENFVDIKFTANIHRNTICQAVTFVETRFVKFECFEKSRLISRNDFDANVEQNFADESRNFHPHKLTVFRVEI